MNESHGLTQRVDVSAQGRLLTVRSVGLDIEMPRGKRRGSVEGFSKASRLRLLKLLATLEAPRSSGYRFKVSFLTLTTREIFHPRIAKSYLVRFFKRLARKFPTMAIVWRMEYQKRGAPHFHLILYNAPFVDKSWLQQIWGEIIGQAKPFTRVERIKSYKHLMSYASKYAAKVEDVGFNCVAKTTGAEKIPEEQRGSAGRVWGVYNRNWLPLAEKREESIPLDASWWMIRRYCQKFWPWLSQDEETGFTVFCDDPYHALDHICSMSKYFINACKHPRFDKSPSLA